MYIPIGKIDPQVYYTEGDEWYYSTTRTSYVGFYRLDFYGRAWAGKNFTSQSPQLIKPPKTTQPIPASVNTTDQTANQYSNILNKSNLKQPYLSEIPISDSLPPNQDEYTLGYYVRYILDLKLSTQPYIIEVNKSTYFSYVNSSQNTYFNNVEVLWKITGPLYDVKENGILMEGGVVDSNLRSIQKASQTIKGIEKYFTDLTLYYIP
jgi:hypothetical protein